MTFELAVILLLMVNCLLMAGMWGNVKGSNDSFAKGYSKGYSDCLRTALEIGHNLSNAENSSTDMKQ